jgi:hypothetical protein
MYFLLILALLTEGLGSKKNRVGKTGELMKCRACDRLSLRAFLAMPSEAEHRFIGRDTGGPLTVHRGQCKELLDRIVVTFASFPGTPSGAWKTPPAELNVI